MSRNFKPSVLDAKTVTLAGACLGLLALSACSSAGSQPTPPAAAKSGLCNQVAAQTLVGRAKVSDEEAKRITGSKTVRQVKPGDPVTMDLRPDRVTIENDPATGKIVRANCG